MVDAYACSTVGFVADPVVDRVPKTLLAAEILFGRLDGNVAKQELDLVQFPSGVAAQASARPTEIVRRQILNGRSFGAVLHHVPHDPLRYALSPRLSCTPDAPKDTAFTNASGYKPGIDCALDPIRNGHCPNMPGLSYQVYDRPMILAALQMRYIQFCGLFPAQPTTQQDPQQRPIPLALERIWIRRLPERFCLVGGQPVAKTNAKVLRTFHTTDSSSQIRSQQAGISGFVREAPDSRQAAVYRARGKLTRFQLNSIAGDNSLVEREPGFGAVPRDELVYCVSVSPLRLLRG